VGAKSGEVSAAHLFSVALRLSTSSSWSSSCLVYAVCHCFLSESCRSQLALSTPAGGGMSGCSRTATGAVSSRVWPRPGPARPSPGSGPRRPSAVPSENLSGAEARRARRATGGASVAVAVRFIVAGALCCACRKVSMNSARFPSTSSFVAAVNFLGGSRAQPSALPVIRFSTCAVASQRWSARFASRSTGSCCGSCERRPPWRTRAATSS